MNQKQQKLKPLGRLYVKKVYYDIRTVLSFHLFTLWDSPFHPNGIKRRERAGDRGVRLTSQPRSHPPCVRRLRVKTYLAKKFGRTMWVDRAWNYYHHQVWMKRRKHIFHKKEGSFQFSCVVRTTGTIPQMISSTSKEFTFRCGNVPLLCPYTGFSQPKRRIVCLVSLFIIPSVRTTIVLNK